MTLSLIYPAIFVFVLMCIGVGLTVYEFYAIQKNDQKAKKKR